MSFVGMSIAAHPHTETTIIRTVWNSWNGLPATIRCNGSDRKCASKYTCEFAHFAAQRHIARSRVGESGSDTLIRLGSVRLSGERLIGGEAHWQKDSLVDSLVERLKRIGSAG